MGPPRPLGNGRLALVGLGCRAGTDVGGLVEPVTDVSLDPLEPVPPAGDGGVDLLHELEVHDRLAVALLPALLLPARHPLRDRVDDVLAVAEDVEVVVDVLGRPEQFEDGAQLTHVVRAVRPPAGRPAVVVDIPGPACGSGVAEGGAVCGSGDRHERLSMSALHRIDAPPTARPPTPAIGRRGRGQAGAKTLTVTATVTRVNPGRSAMACSKTSSSRWWALGPIWTSSRTSSGINSTA